MKELNIGSDFSGVGAFNQALQRLEIQYKELFACDMDKYARQTFCLNYGTIEDCILSKIDVLGKTTINAKDYSFYFPQDVYEREIPKESLDIYMSSPPCQSFSLAGKRKGEDDNRGILFYNTHEFIQKNKPRLFIIENVKGLLSDDKGKTFQRWIDFLGGKSVNGNTVIFPHEEATPYHVYYQVLNSKHYGIPQNRERVFIIGIRDDVDNTFSFPKPFHLEKRLKDVLESEVDEKYFLSDKMVAGFVKKVETSDWNFEPLDETNESAKCITAQYAKMAVTANYLKVGHIKQDTQASQVYSDEGITPSICAGTHGYANGYVETKIGAIRGRNPENPKSRVSGLPTEQMLEINENGTSNALTTVQKDNVVILSNIYGGFGEDNAREHTEYSPTIRTAKGGGHIPSVIVPTNNSKGYDKAEEEDSINFSNPNSETRRGRVGHKVSQTLDTACNQGIYTQQRIRRLTPLECFRLMDFNENFKWEVSDSQAYKQAGNSICVGVLVEILKKLLKIK